MLERPRVEFRECRALAGHHVLKAGLKKHQGVDLPFAHDRLSELADGRPGFVEAEKHLALAEEGRLRGVDVLAGVGLGLQNAAAEGDDLAIVVADGKHQPVAEVRVGVPALLAAFEDASVDEQLLAKLVLDGPLTQRRGAGWGVAELPVLRHGGVDAALFQVLAGRVRHLMAQKQLVVPLRQFLVRAQHLGAHLGRRLGIGVPHLLLDADARRLRQALHRLHEGQAIMLHHKAEGVSPRAAAKAVVGVRGRPHIEGGRLLIMKRAQPHPV